MKRFAVFTVVFGHYDSVRETPSDPREDTDYACFSDQQMDSHGWTFFRQQSAESSEGFRASRGPKAAVPRELSRYEATCYVDGNIQLVRSISQLFEEFLDSGADVGLFLHPDRATIREEAMACAREGKLEKSLGERQIAGYGAQGYGDQFPLFEGSVIFRRQASERAESFGKAWLQEISLWNTRDQLSLGYCLWITRCSVYVFKGSPRRLPRFFRYFPHNSQESHGICLRVLSDLLQLLPALGPIFYSVSWVAKNLSDYGRKNS